jgi:hypothetical protein
MATRIGLTIGKLMSNHEICCFVLTNLYVCSNNERMGEEEARKPNHHKQHCWVGGLEHFLFSIIYGIILPID